MISFEFGEDDKRYCEKIAKRRHRGEPGKFYTKDDPPMKADLVGVYGEVAYSKMTGLPINENRFNAGDCGIDFPDGAQVKASAIDTLPNLIIEEDKWDSQIAQFFVLVWVESFDMVHVIGKISREKADKVKVLTDLGNGPCWLIQNEYLLNY